MKRKFLLGTAAILKPYVAPKPKGTVVSATRDGLTLQRVHSLPGFGEYSVDEATGVVTVNGGEEGVVFTYAHEVVNKARRGRRYAPH